MHEDGTRQLEDGLLTLALMCKNCREEQRAKWIAAVSVVLPLAVARYRRQDDNEKS